METFKQYIEALTPQEMQQIINRRKIEKFKRENPDKFNSFNRIGDQYVGKKGEILNISGKVYKKFVFDNSSFLLKIKLDNKKIVALYVSREIYDSYNIGDTIDNFPIFIIFNKFQEKAREYQTIAVHHVGNWKKSIPGNLISMLDDAINQIRLQKSQGEIK